MNIKDLILEQLEESRTVLDNIINDPAMLTKIQEAAETMASAISKGNKIISCGNGGSLCDAMHFAEEMTGRFRNDRKAFPAIAISDPSHLTCTANDMGFSSVFSRYIEAVGKKGDVLLAISTSGNSQNIVQAVQAAKTAGIFVIALSGKDGGQLAGEADIALVVPHQGYSDRIQEIHIKIIHILVYLIEKINE